jgi:hypothetical protein
MQAGERDDPGPADLRAQAARNLVHTERWGVSSLRGEIYSYILKGICREIFKCRFFPESVTPLAPEYPIGAISKF